jgi:hypothetical protein
MLGLKFISPTIKQNGHERWCSHTKEMVRFSKDYKLNFK